MTQQPTGKLDWPACEICGGTDWRMHYQGPVRKGAFGTSLDGIVGRCGVCRVDRLNESACLREADYQTGTYRSQLGQTHAAADFFAEHDLLQHFTLDAFWPRPLRGKTVADVGCGAGSLLDHMSGLAQRLIAIEPAAHYHDSLRGRGYDVFSFAGEAARAHRGTVDAAFSIQVIEHVADPRAFLADMRQLLKPDGLAVISTPNRDHLLMHLLPDEYRHFFYRSAHRWYFDQDTLTRCAERAGFAVEKFVQVQRYSFSNFVCWLRDRKPTGSQVLPGLEANDFNRLWHSFLIGSGQAETIYAFLRPSD